MVAEELAEILFGDAKRLVRIDMSEYMEAHTVSNLIGAPPGYVGHEREGLLISALRTHPHSIVLFDEVEKAHARIFDLFLQIFGDGRLAGTHGKSADFTQSVIILTSNIDPRPERTPVGFEAGATAPTSDARDALLTRMRPELVNRIDEVVSFNPLDDAALRRIVDRYVAGIEDLLAARELALELEGRCLRPAHRARYQPAVRSPRAPPCSRRPLASATGDRDPQAGRGDRRHPGLGGRRADPLRGPLAR